MSTINQIIMGLPDDPHQIQLRSAGWRSRGYLPHFDGIALPQFITINLADAIPRKVIDRSQQELRSMRVEAERVLLQASNRKVSGYGLRRRPAEA